MYQPPAPAAAIPFSSAYEHNAEYNLQPQADHEELRDAPEKVRYPARRPKRPNYRPTPLRWPFIACLIVLFCATIALIVYVRQTMPNSDSDAIVDQSVKEVRGLESIPDRRPFARSVLLVERNASDSANAAVSSSAESSTASPSPSPSPSPSSVITTPPASASSPDGHISIENVQTTSSPLTSSTPAPPAPSSISSTPAPAPTTSSSPTPVQQSSTSISPSTPSSLSASTPTGPSSPANKVVDQTSSTDLNGRSSTTTSTTSISSHSVSRTPSGSSVTGSGSAQMKIPIISTSIIETNVTQTLTRSATTRTEFSTGTSTLFGTTTKVFTSVVSASVITSSVPVVGGPPPPPPVTTIPASTYTTTGRTTLSFIQTFTHKEQTTTRIITTTKVSDVETTATVTQSAVTVTGAPFEATATATKAPFIITVKESTIEVTSVGVVPTGTVAFTTSSVATDDPVVYVQIGPTTITSYYTIEGPIQTKIPDPVTVAITSVFGGTTITQVRPVVIPQTLVTDFQQIQTKVFTPPAQTYLTTIPGEVTTKVIYITPVPVATVDVVQQVVTTIGGTVGTFTRQVGDVFTTTVNGLISTVTAKEAQVYTSVVGGVVSTVQVDRPQTNFGPITMTIVSEIGGTTQLFTTTEAETIITSINGQLTTLTTSVPRTFTSVIGGTPTTMVVTTTPSATSAIPFTVVVTGSGTVRTLVSTFAPTTLVTTISGKLTTIVSTPSPSTFLSTVAPSTTTILSVSTPAASQPTGNSSIIVAVAESFDLTLGDYFIGRFLPTILAVLLSIPLRVVDLNAKLYQPFYALAREGGALGANSLNLHYNGFRGFATPFVTLFQGHPVPFLTTLLVLCSALLAPLSAEALGLKVHGTCRANVIEGCATVLGVSPVPMHLLLALLAFMVTVLVILLFFLRRWETGLHASPWSIAGIASLALSRDVRVHSSRESRIRAATDEKRYALGFFENDRGEDEYGVVLFDDAGRSLQRDPAAGVAGYHDEEMDEEQNGRQRPRHTVPFMALGFAWRLVFAAFLCGIIALVVYYTLTESKWSSFKSFMDSQTFGVRFFFAALGVIIDFCWTTFFISVAIMGPYQQMSQRAQPPERSILVSRPTNGFFGVYAAFRERNVFLLLVALMTVVAEFLPILLSNVPHTLTQNETTHVVCSRMSVGILAAMVLVILGSLFVKWPHMPVDPRSIAGAMYYVSGSSMLADFEGVSRMTRKERERHVREMGKRYFYGDIYTPGGRRRTGVDGDSGFGDDVHTAYVGHHF